MESTNTMDNNYGRQTPPVIKSEEKLKNIGVISKLYLVKRFYSQRGFMKSNTQSSMEYHIKKDEYYYIQKGN